MMPQLSTKFFFSFFTMNDPNKKANYQSNELFSVANFEMETLLASYQDEEKQLAPAIAVNNEGPQI